MSPSHADEHGPAVPPIGDPPPPEGPWLVIQVLEPLEGSERRTRRHLQALTEALGAHEVAFTDVHPAVDDPTTILACCPDTHFDSDVRLRAIADLMARLLQLPSGQAVRIGAYPDLTAAHAAAGD
jgi:hypothetical protein